jgi:hypothetical protein
MACVIALAIVAISCSKKEAAPAVVPSTANTATDPSPATPQPAVMDTRPIEDASALNARIAAAQAAMKAKDYERAASTLTISHQSPVPMTGDQLMTYNSAMASQQNQIAAAAAAGDPKAKAVYEAMRQRASEHR